MNSKPHSKISLPIFLGFTLHCLAAFVASAQNSGAELRKSQPQPPGPTSVTNTAAKGLSPAEVLNQLASNSNRIAQLQKMIKTETAKVDADLEVLWTRQEAGKISALDASKQQTAWRKAVRKKFEPWEKEIAERRLAMEEIKRSHKLP